MVRVSIVSKTGFVSGCSLGNSKHPVNSDKVVASLACEKDGNNTSEFIEDRINFYSALHNKYIEKIEQFPDKRKYVTRLRCVDKALDKLKSVRDGRVINIKGDITGSKYLNTHHINDRPKIILNEDIKLCRMQAYEYTTCSKLLFTIISDLIMARSNSLELYRYVNKFKKRGMIKEMGIIEKIDLLARGKEEATSTDEFVVFEMYSILSNLVEKKIVNYTGAEVYKEFISLYNEVNEQLIDAFYDCMHEVYGVECYGHRGVECLLKIDENNWLNSTTPSRIVPFTLELYLDNYRVCKKKVVLEIKQNEQFDNSVEFSEDTDIED